MLYLWWVVMWDAPRVVMEALGNTGLATCNASEDEQGDGDGVGVVRP
jgi:hypothetical protein